MTITANLADGSQLSFPDGTDPAIVQRTVKQIVTGTHPSQAAPADPTAAAPPATASPAAPAATGRASPPPAALNPQPPAPVASSGGGDGLMNDASKMAQNFAEGGSFGMADAIGANIAKPLIYAGRNLSAAITGGKYVPFSDVNDQVQNMESQKLSDLQAWNSDNPGKAILSQGAGAVYTGGTLAKAFPDAATALQTFAKSHPWLTSAATGAVVGGLYGGGTAVPGHTVAGAEAGAAGGAILGPAFKYAGDELLNPALKYIGEKAGAAGSALQDFIRSHEEQPQAAAPGGAPQQPGAGPMPGGATFSNITGKPLGAADQDIAGLKPGELPLSTGVRYKDADLLRIEENARQGIMGPDSQAQMKASDQGVFNTARGWMQQLKGVTNQDSNELLQNSVQQFQKAASSVKAQAQALYKQRDSLMADSVLNRQAMAQGVGKDMFAVLTDPSNIAGFKSKSGAAAKQLYADFRDIVRGSPDSMTSEGKVSTSLPPDHPDAPYQAGGPQTKAPPEQYKSPILKWIADRGGVVVGSDLDTKLRDLDFGPGKPGTPVGLFKKDVLGGKVRGRASVDAVPVSEFNDQFGTHFAGGDDGYMKPEDIVEAIRNESFGKKLGVEPEDPTGQQEQFQQIKDGVFSRAKQLGVKGLTNDDVEKIAQNHDDGTALDDAINQHQQDKYFSDNKPSATKTFSAKNAVPFNDLAAWRQDAAHLALTDESTSGHLAKKLIQAYEGWMDNLQEKDLLSGSPEVAKVARDAGMAWKNYKTLFGSENSPVLQGMTKPYDLNPADFVNKIFGAKGMNGNAMTALNMRKMVGALPQEAQQEFKDNVFSGLISRAFEGAGDADQMSLAKLRNNLSALQNSQVYKEQFRNNADSDMIITNLIKDIDQHVKQTGRADVRSPSGGHSGRIMLGIVNGLAKLPVPGIGEIRMGMEKAQQYSEQLADQKTLNRAMKQAAQAAHSAARKGPVYDIDGLRAGLLGGAAAGNVVQQNNEGAPSK